MTAADLALEVARCPFPGCGQRCKAAEYSDGSWRVECLSIFSCEYLGPRAESRDEAVTAHNTLSRRAALFPELVAFLADIRRNLNAEVHPAQGEHWIAKQIAALLKRAAEITPEVQR